MGWGPVDWVGRVLPEPKFENKCTSFFDFFGFVRPLLRYRGSGSPGFLSRGEELRILVVGCGQVWPPHYFKAKVIFLSHSPQSCSAQVITGNIFHSHLKNTFFSRLTFPGRSTIFFGRLLLCKVFESILNLGNGFIARMLFATKKPLDKEDIMGFTVANLRQ